MLCKASRAAKKTERKERWSQPRLMLLTSGHATHSAVRREHIRPKMLNPLFMDRGCTAMLKNAAEIQNQSTHVLSIDSTHVQKHSGHHCRRRLHSPACQVIPHSYAAGPRGLHLKSRLLRVLCLCGRRMWRIGRRAWPTPCHLRSGTAAAGAAQTKIITHDSSWSCSCGQHASTSDQTETPHMNFHSAQAYTDFDAGVQLFLPPGWMA